MTVDPTTALTEEEITEFARVLTYAATPKCNVKHEFHTEGECDGEATYALRTCNGHGLACAAAIRVVKKAQADGSTCQTCGRTCADDWRFIPL